MSAYRQVAPPKRFSMAFSVIPSWVFAVAVAALLLGLLAAQVTTRSVEISCARAAGWTCETTVSRGGFAISRTTTSFSTVRAVSLRALDDGGGVALVHDGEQAWPIATFHLDEIGAAHEALREFEAKLRDESRAELAVRVPLRASTRSAVVFAILFVLGAFIVAPRGHIVVDDGILDARPMLIGKPLRVPLSKLVGVVPGPDRSLLFTLRDGTKHLITVGLTEREVARRASELRETIEATRR